MSDSNTSATSTSVPEALKNLRSRKDRTTRSGSSEKESSGRKTASTSTMMRLYSDDSPGLMVDPVVVLVMSLVFIGSVFVLHIWGRLTRG
ncbi:Pre protein translocase Sec Sec61-beta subunit [Ramicandelaber brevisporus]|nr:Pre protein translocase Sec Sec61-beta subunit [Ramicandelaber brevisporus]